MSTHARIGIKNKDNTITSIYCHHDGYIENGVGDRLKKYYTDEEKIRKLMKLGDMSALGTEPISNPNAWKNPELSSRNWLQDLRKLHPADMCDTYASRGENVPAKTTSEEYFWTELKEEYMYLFKDGHWLIVSQ